MFRKVPVWPQTSYIYPKPFIRHWELYNYHSSIVESYRDKHPDPHAEMVLIRRFDPTSLQDRFVNYYIIVNLDALDGPVKIHFRYWDDLFLDHDYGNDVNTVSFIFISPGDEYIYRVSTLFVRRMIFKRGFFEATEISRLRNLAEALQTVASTRFLNGFWAYLRFDPAIFGKLKEGRIPGNLKKEVLEIWRRHGELKSLAWEPLHFGPEELRDFCEAWSNHPLIPRDLEFERDPWSKDFVRVPLTSRRPLNLQGFYDPREIIIEPLKIPETEVLTEPTFEPSLDDETSQMIEPLISVLKDDYGSLKILEIGVGCILLGAESENLLIFIGIDCPYRHVHYLSICHIFNAIDLPIRLFRFFPKDEIVEDDIAPFIDLYRKDFDGHIERIHHVLRMLAWLRPHIRPGGSCDLELPEVFGSSNICNYTSDPRRADGILNVWKYEKNTDDYRKISLLELEEYRDIVREDLSSKPVLEQFEEETPKLNIEYPESEEDFLQCCYYYLTQRFTEQAYQDLYYHQMIEYRDDELCDAYEKHFGKSICQILEGWSPEEPMTDQQKEKWIRREEP